MRMTPLPTDRTLLHSLNLPNAILCPGARGSASLHFDA